MLEAVLKVNNLPNKPQSIFNVDESDIQLINKPGKVLAKKGVKHMHVLTPRKRGEKATVMACCNAEGQFIPPVLILKGVDKKQELGDGLPHGSQVYMNPKSSYINSVLFLKWFLELFFFEKAVREMPPYS
jgi:hypothetical protein